MLGRALHDGLRRAAHARCTSRAACSPGHRTLPTLQAAWATGQYEVGVGAALVAARIDPDGRPQGAPLHGHGRRGAWIPAPFGVGAALVAARFDPDGRPQGAPLHGHGRRGAWIPAPFGVGAALVAARFDPDGRPQGAPLHGHGRRGAWIPAPRKGRPYTARASRGLDSRPIRCRGSPCGCPGMTKGYSRLMGRGPSRPMYFITWSTHTWS